ncbi:MAG: hypothetical protein HDQ91_03315 [Desulfovibrio sp.]|nr:hypothetical protein [Desulfovibrio sp.]
MISCFAIRSSLRRIAANTVWPQFTAKCLNVKPEIPLRPAIGLWLFALAIALLLPVAGCSRSESAQPERTGAGQMIPKALASLETFHNGSLNLPDKAGAPRKIYVDCHGNEKLTPHLDQHLEKALAGGNFRIAGAPSEAGYILHVNILDHGSVAPESLKSAVRAGYGNRAGFSGAGADGMLVDALMVQRRVPEAKRESLQKMKNVSSRNAIGSSQMRIGVLGSDREHDAEAFSAAIAAELAGRVK